MPIISRLSPAAGAYNQHSRPNPTSTTASRGPAQDSGSEAVRARMRAMAGSEGQGEVKLGRSCRTRAWSRTAFGLMHRWMRSRQCEVLVLYFTSLNRCSLLLEVDRQTDRQTRHTVPSADNSTDTGLKLPPRHPLAQHRRLVGSRFRSQELLSLHAFTREKAGFAKSACFPPQESSDQVLEHTWRRTASTHELRPVPFPCATCRPPPMQPCCDACFVSQC